MSGHPFSNVAIAAAINTRVARQLPEYTSLSLACEAALSVLDAAGIDRSEVDGVAGPSSLALAYLLGLGPVWQTGGPLGVDLVGEVVAAVAAGVVETVLVVDAMAGVYTDRESTAPWTRPTNEFVVSTGLFTAAEFALVARRHMEMFDTKPEHLATVAATIRNNGHVNPQAVYYDKGPFTPEDILASRMVADPFHLLDCSMTAEGGCALVVTTADRAKDLRLPPAYVLGFGVDRFGPAYQHPPSWDLRSAVVDGIPNGYVGRRAARRAFSMAGLSPADVDVCEFYDPFSFEIIRQFEAYEFCGDGEGGEFIMGGTIGPGGRYPVETDGGLLSFNHSGTPQLLARVARSVHQVQQICETNQVPGASIALCSNQGAGALGVSLMLVGSDRPQ